MQRKLDFQEHTCKSVSRLSMLRTFIYVILTTTAQWCVICAVVSVRRIWNMGSFEGL